MNKYQLLDSGHFRKLEQIGDFRIVRPALSAVWEPQSDRKVWQDIDAEFVREQDSGDWKINNHAIKDPFYIDVSGIQFQMRLTSFGHLGIFPEQHQPWLQMEKWVQKQVKSGRAIRVLNLFAYTGGSSLFCARAGAEVAHVDASKGTVRWASENAKASDLGSAKIRWLVDDVKEFVAKELRRDSRYHAVILDPPSYGKGDKKQIWKIEKDLIPLLHDLKKLLAPDEENMVCLSAHTEGYTPTSLTNQLNSVFGEGQVQASELVIPSESQYSLPSGAGAIWWGRPSI